MPILIEIMSSVKINSAFYAVDNYSRGPDIAGDIRASLNMIGYVNVRNSLLEEDPCFGKTKYLWVNYIHNGEEKTICIREGGQLTSLQLNSLKKIPIEIKSAYYDVDNYARIDIADHIMAVLSGGSYVAASNSLPVGDTCPGKVKSLWVNYIHNGEEKTICIREGGQLTSLQLNPLK